MDALRVLARSNDPDRADLVEGHIDTYLTTETVSVWQALERLCKGIRDGHMSCFGNSPTRTSTTSRATSPSGRDVGPVGSAYVIAASASVAVGHAAISNYPDQRFTLRNGTLVIRQHPRS